MYTYINDEGIVYAEAIDHMDNIYYEHPISKEKIVGFNVPMFKEAVEMVKEAATVVPEMGYIGWDVAISEKGPVIVEGNCFPGVFQVKPSLAKKKEGIIPKYNKVMKIFDNSLKATVHSHINVKQPQKKKYIQNASDVSDNFKAVDYNEQLQQF